MTLHSRTTQRRPLANSVDQFPVRMLAVIVLYKMQPSESATFRTLRAAISSLPDGQADIRILLYDNTPGGQDIDALSPDILYKEDFKNGGLATAYNYALQIAEEENYDWLLTLDQDTSLPIDFLCKVCHAATFVAPMPTVAAIVPKMSCDGRSVGPFTFIKYRTLSRTIPNGFIGIPLQDVYAINSASTIKVSALKAIGGYDPRFNLDFSDLAIYHRLHCQNLQVFVAGDIQVEHEVSGYDLKNLSTASRYVDTCRAEEAAYDEWMGSVARVALTARLMRRLIYQLWRVGGSLCHFKICFRFLCRRLFYSRKYRMESWKQSVSQRLAV